MFELLADISRLSPRKLYKRIGDLREFIEISDGAADPYLLSRATAELARVEERAKLGAEFTVAALVGGTGSGKSTLFNALTGFNFADAGEIRPTTERATACTWRAKADALLDHLDIDQNRRIEHESVLAPVSDELSGLVLLDLPDYDSVKFTNSLTVTRLMPMLDVLIWVVDPQKYADQLLHRDYLKNLRGRSRQMVVVMNHIDTVLESQVPILMQDLRRLLDTDGLSDVPVYSLSALARTGLQPLRELLRKVVAAPSTNLITAASQVDQVSLLLSGTLGDKTLDLGQLVQAQAEITEKVLHASGVPTVIEQINHGGDTLSPTALSAPVQPAPTLSAAICDTWVEQVTSPLPTRWAAQVHQQIASADQFRRRIALVYSSLPLPHISRRPLAYAVLAAFVILAGGIAGAVFLLSQAALLLRIACVFAAIILAGCVYYRGRVVLRKAANTAGKSYQEEVRDKISVVVQESLIDPPKQVLERYVLAQSLLAN